jgi:tetratricopeptide (TPR) repeat protein
MRQWRHRFWGLLSLASLMALLGCADFLTSRDNDIRESTQAIEAARNDIQRAKAYSSRGVAYSEKARYSRFIKRIPNDQYERLFDLAIKDHNQAVALNPASAEIYFNRGEAYYDRGSLDLVESTMPSTNGMLAKDKGATKAWFDAAASDFAKATQKNPKNPHAFDMLGLTFESNGEADNAIQAYTQELALDSRLGKLRLATAYCEIGVQYQAQKDFAAAIKAYQKSIEFGRADDKSCVNDPFGAMAAIYMSETHQYDKAWEMVHRAQKAGQWIAPELIDLLKKDSGRTN